VKGDWVAVDIKALRPMQRPVTLAQLKADPAFADLALVRLSRLSVAPVSAEHWKLICHLGGWR
jgi:predicted RNA-binding protein with PUA-like domain